MNFYQTFFSLKKKLAIKYIYFYRHCPKVLPWMMMFFVSNFVLGAMRDLWLEQSRHLLTFHCEFLEYWNTRKSVRIWQHISCLLDEGIPKIWKKLNSHDDFLSYLQNSTANSAHLAAHSCTALVCPQKATVRIEFLPHFWNALIK